MESNHDSQIQNLKSYRLDDRAIARSISRGGSKIKRIVGAFKGEINKNGKENLFFVLLGIACPLVVSLAV